MSGCERRDAAGAWVLGALGDEEAGAFAAHLEGCKACREAVAELQGVADVLPMAAPQLAPPPELKSRIMAVVQSEAQLLRAAGPEADRPPAREGAERRERGWRRFFPPRLAPAPAAALATVLLALGVATGVLISGGGDGSPTSTHDGFGPRGTQVALRVSGDHGRLVLHGMPEPPRGRVYEVWLVHGSQPRPTRTLFTVPRDGATEVAIAESLKGVDKVLVTDEPMGGSRAPTTQPIAGASIT